jgi:hypothetical protein
MEICDGACVDEKSDPNNCGSCGHVCQGGQQCFSGTCACPADKSDSCGGECVDEQTDVNNCGACHNVCPNGSGCNAGQCGACAGKICGSACVDTKSDPAHCGACDNACPQGDLCTEGVCTCAGGGVDCGNDDCAVLAASPTDCGGCGHACSADRACEGGMCGCRPPQVKTPAGCSDPKHDPAHCGPMNQTCNTTTPVCAGALGCVLVAVCNSTGVVCDGGCYLPDDFKRNPFHCGQCGNSCAADEVCVDGHCTSFRVPPVCDGTTCGNGGNCCPYPGLQGITICVDGECPMAP